MIITDLEAKFEGFLLETSLCNTCGEPPLCCIPYLHFFISSNQSNASFLSNKTPLLYICEYHQKRHPIQTGNGKGRREFKWNQHISWNGVQPGAWSIERDITGEGKGGNQEMGQGRRRVCTPTKLRFS